MISGNYGCGPREREFRSAHSRGERSSAVGVVGENHAVEEEPLELLGLVERGRRRRGRVVAVAEQGGDVALEPGLAQIDAERRVDRERVEHLGERRDVVAEAAEREARATARAQGGGAV